MGERFDGGERRAPELDGVREGVVDAESTCIGRMGVGGDGEYEYENNDGKISAA
jgi:hypothetical protein